jgi:hypothetical protein
VSQSSRTGALYRDTLSVLGGGRVQAFVRVPSDSNISLARTGTKSLYTVDENR